MLDDLFAYLRGKKILILGCGREGLSSLKFILKYKNEIKYRSLTLADHNNIVLPPEINAKQENIQIVCGESYLKSLSGQDLVLKSPGISFREFTILRGRQWPITLAEFPETEITGQMDLFLRFSPAHIIGVSGTKGKSTTTTLCYEMLRQAYTDCYLLGNIGIPVWDVIDRLSTESYCAVEMSSHQLEFCSASPGVAVLTNFYPEHLDHYRDYEEYLGAKMNILTYQRQEDTLVLNASEETLMKRAGQRAVGRLVLVTDVEQRRFKADAKPVHCSYELGTDHEFVIRHANQSELYHNVLPENHAMLGRHVLNDALMAMAATAAMGVTPAQQLAAVRAFRGIAHRLEPVGCYKGILFFNDSIATIPRATLLALKALQQVGPVSTLLLGGMDRGLDYSEFIEALLVSNIRTLICFPDTGWQIAQQINALKSLNDMCAFPKTVNVYTMEEAVRLAYSVARSGEICLLSPAASSYNQYKNFEERGNLFKAAVAAGGRL